MITINLLPKKEIKRLKLLKLHSFLFSSILLLSGFAVLVIFLFLGSDLLLRRNLGRINQQLENKMQEGDAPSFLELKNKIDQLNQTLEQVARLQTNHIRLSPSLIELSRLVPPELSLTSLKIYRQEGYAEIAGIAKRRDKLLEFQDSIEKSDFFEAVESPLSNLTSKENIEFQLRFKIKGEFLK